MRSVPSALVALAAAALLPAPALAASDLEVWTELGVTHALSKRWRLGLEQRVRLEDGASHLQSVMPELHLTWRPRKWIALRLGYRYSLEPVYSREAIYADSWHEPYAEASLRRKLARWVRAELRLGFHEEIGRPWSAGGAVVYEHVARQRLELEWLLGEELSLHTSGELFLRLADAEHEVLHKWRATVALERELYGHDLSLFYALEDRLASTSHPERHPTAHILGVALHFSL